MAPVGGLVCVWAGSFGVSGGWCLCLARIRLPRGRLRVVCGAVTTALAGGSSSFDWLSWFHMASSHQCHVKLRTADSFTRLPSAAPRGPCARRTAGAHPNGPGCWARRRCTPVGPVASAGASRRAPALALRRPRGGRATPRPRLLTVVAGLGWRGRRLWAGRTRPVGGRAPRGGVGAPPRSPSGHSCAGRAPRVWAGGGTRSIMLDGPTRQRPPQRGARHVQSPFPCMQSKAPSKSQTLSSATLSPASASESPTYTTMYNSCYTDSAPAAHRTSQTRDSRRQDSGHMKRTLTWLPRRAPNRPHTGETPCAPRRPRPPPAVARTPGSPPRGRRPPPPGG